MRADGRVVLDQRAPADDDVVPNDDAFAHARLVADDHALTERRAGEDDGAGRDDRSGAELERPQLLRLRGRARGKHRLLPDHRVVEDLAAVTDDRPRIDDRGVRDLRVHAGTVSSDACSCSSARTTTSPSRAARWASPSPRTSARKCSHSSRSGSVLAIFGLNFAPVRVCHSPCVLVGCSGALSYTVTLCSSSMSSNTAIFSRPTTV